MSSVKLSYAPLYAHANMMGVKNTDRSLGVLFDYLESHYNDDEYVVQLYSDHGSSVYDNPPSYEQLSDWSSLYGTRGRSPIIGNSK